jgi:hypothetical protein
MKMKTARDVVSTTLCEGQLADTAGGNRLPNTPELKKTVEAALDLAKDLEQGGRRLPPK